MNTKTESKQKKKTICDHSTNEVDHEIKKKKL